MIATLLQHRSIRKYKQTPIEERVLNVILESAVSASNTGNMQVYSVIVTKEEKLKKQLWEAHFKQNMVLQAPVLLTFCADINRFHHWCKLRGATPSYDNFLWFFNASIDALLAAQNATIAAEAFGLGICYLGTTTYMADKIVEILKLPQGVLPITTLTLGYPDETPELTDRLPLESVIHNETYHQYSDQEIEKFYKEKENSPQTASLLQINQLENLAKIFTEKRYTLKDNLYFSKQFLKVIENQGFMKNE